MEGNAGHFPCFPKGVMTMDKTKLILITFFLTTALFLFSATTWAMPQGGNIVSGNSTITRPDAQTLHINQTTEKSIINWQGYSIGANEKVQYFQSGSRSISLNRVVGQDPSLIYGQLSANGQIWVINPNGLLIGSGAKINTGSFLGSTLNISDSDFLSGNYSFRQTGALSFVANQGSITSQNGGYVVLISPTITNEGSITSTFGKAGLASGSVVKLSFANNNLIGLTLDKKAAESALGITNKGTISANGGKVIVSAKVASDLIKTVINNEGVIEEKNGEIFLLGGMEHNAVEVSGRPDASAPGGGIGEVRLFQNGKLIKSDGFYRDIAVQSKMTPLKPAALNSKAIYQDMRSVIVKEKKGAVTVKNLGSYSKEMTTKISSELGHSQTPMIIYFGKDNSLFSVRQGTGEIMRISNIYEYTSSYNGVSLLPSLPQANDF